MLAQGFKVINKGRQYHLVGTDVTSHQSVGSMTTLEVFLKS